MGLLDVFKPGHRHSDPSVRARAVHTLHDENLLAEIARTDDSPRVRQAAVDRIESEQLLVEVAMDAKQIDVRIAAVQKISSQAKLAEIIKSRRNQELMGACFARITDSNILATIARDPSYNITARRIAFENFADESFLADVAEELDPTPRKTQERKSDSAVEAILKQYGGTRVVRAIGKFRGSEKALRALGTIARKGGESGELAIEYLARGLAYSNPVTQRCAAEELASLKDPEQVAVIVSQLDNPALRERLADVLRQIDTPEARAALGQD